MDGLFVLLARNHNVKTETAGHRVWRAKISGLYCSSDAALSIGIGTSSMEARLGGHIHRISRLKQLTIQVGGHSEGRRSEITHQYPHGLPISLKEFRGELKAIPAYRSGFSHGEFTMVSTKFRQPEVFDLVDGFAHGINHLKGIALRGCDHQGLIALIPHVELVLNGVSGLVHALGCCTPGMDVTVFFLHVGIDGIVRCPVNICMEIVIQGHQGDVICFFDPDKQPGLRGAMIASDELEFGIHIPGTVQQGKAPFVCHRCTEDRGLR